MANKVETVDFGSDETETKATAKKAKAKVTWIPIKRHPKTVAKLIAESDKLRAEAAKLMLPLVEGYFQKQGVELSADQVIRFGSRYGTLSAFGIAEKGSTEGVAFDE